MVKRAFPKVDSADLLPFISRLVKNQQLKKTSLSAVCKPILVIATYVIIDLAFSEWEVSDKVVGALNSATTE